MPIIDQDTEAAFLASIRANPSDDAPRLIYADWLDEHGGVVECERCREDEADKARRNAIPYAIPNLWPNLCSHCNGTGHVSNGNAERAEFIRVQCELHFLGLKVASLLNEETDWGKCESDPARWCPNCGDCSCKNPEESLSDPGCHLHSPHSSHNPYPAIDRRTARLKEREAELWRTLGTSFDLKVPYVRWLIESRLPSDSGIDKEENICVVRRGFVESVLAPLRVLVGGPCRNCQGDGDVGPHNSGYGSSGPCPDCGGDWFSGEPGYSKGSGRLRANLPHIMASRQSCVTRVVVTNKRPLLGDGSMAGKFEWLLRDPDDRANWRRPHELPRRIYRRLKGAEIATFGTVKRYNSEPAAMAALSDALIAWAQKRPPFRLAAPPNIS